MNDGGGGGGRMKTAEEVVYSRGSNMEVAEEVVRRPWRQLDHESGGSDMVVAEAMV